MTLAKENVFVDFWGMIKQSWTYDRMTNDERSRLYNLLTDSVPVFESVKGTYRQRWAILQAVYAAYLSGIGYTNFGWREPDKNDPHPF